MPVVAFFCRTLLSQRIILIVTFIVHCSLPIGLMCPNIIAFLLYCSDCSIRAFYVVMPKSGTRFCCYWCSEQYSKSSSRHTIVCRAAQEAGMPHRGYTDRKKENIIFTPLYLSDTLSDWNQICCRVDCQLGESTFKI